MTIQLRSNLRLPRRTPSVCSSPSPVKAIQNLPDLESLPLHQYRPAAEDGDQLCDLTYNASRADPRVCDYVVNPANWTAEKRGCDLKVLWDDDRGAPQGANTVKAILGADIAGYQCEVCDGIGEQCHGEECVAIYKAFLASHETRYLEIRDTGIMEMGMGMFAKRDIKKGTILCEYTGRLFPIDPVVFPRDSSYTWHISGTCRVDSTVYGNIGRFANHHCTQDNCDPVYLMYGRRKVVAYRAKRAIAKGEQLYVNYGSDYFFPSKPCRCTAAAYPHLLGPSGRVVPAPTKKMYWDARKLAKANKEKTRRSRSSSPETKLSKLTRQAGVLARSQL